MKNSSIVDLIKLSEQTEIPASASRGGSSNSKLSFGIVNSEANGKRVSFSKSLVQSLDLKGSAEIALVPDKGCILIASELPHKNVVICKFSAKGDKGGRRLSYNSEAVCLLTKTFGLNFADHVSVSYDGITVETLENGTPVAIVEIFNKHPVVADVQ